MEETEAGPVPHEPENAAQSRPLHALIERWFADHFHGSAITRNTDHWNICFAAKEALKRLLASQE